MKNIEIRDLEIKYEDKTVLQNFSADIPLGKKTCITGESGCGKTSLINVLLGILRQTSGTVENVPEKISAVFQEDRLSEEHTVFSNAKMATNAPDAEVYKVLDGLLISDVANKKVKNVSGGQKRRTAIARALLANFDLLILDEAFSGLDSETKATVSAFVERRTVGKTVIAVTHSPDEYANASILEINS